MKVLHSRLVLAQKRGWVEAVLLFPDNEALFPLLTEFLFPLRRNKEQRQLETICRRLRIKVYCFLPESTADNRQSMYDNWCPPV